MHEEEFDYGFEEEEFDSDMYENEEENSPSDEELLAMGFVTGFIPNLF